MNPSPSNPSEVGVVLIGRNEGDRLVACLDSLSAHASRTVYVDSGSTDDSVAQATQRGVTVVQLDTDQPFTAARARNAGYEKLIAQHPDTPYVQFVDGDCVVDEHWLATAIARLNEDKQLAVVCGRRREINPHASIYNRLCDIEWDTPVGPAQSCGGDAMFRRAAFDQVGGYNPTIIAGEEPELCFRLRQQGWSIERIDAEMTRHDANMTSVSQWIRRHQRAGHAYAEGAAMHGNSPERYCVRDVHSILLWSLDLPFFILAVALLISPYALIAFIVYPLMVLKIGIGQRRRGRSWFDALLFGANCIKAKVPQALGVLRYHLARLRGRRNTIIEYK